MRVILSLSLSLVSPQLTPLSRKIRRHLTLSTHKKRRKSTLSHGDKTLANTEKKFDFASSSVREFVSRLRSPPRSRRHLPPVRPPPHSPRRCPPCSCRCSCCPRRPRWPRPPTGARTTRDTRPRVTRTMSTKTSKFYPAGLSI